MYTYVVASLQVAAEGLTFREVLANVPTDPASVFVYLLLAVSLGVIAWSNRPRRRRGRQAG